LREHVGIPARQPNRAILGELKMDREMRRRDRAMTRRDSERFLEQALVGRLGTSWRNEPYVVPLNFVYDAGKVYLHCSREGRKFAYLSKNPKISFEVDQLIRIRRSKKPCDFSAYYRSVIVAGEARVVKAVKAKRQVLQMFVRKYGKSKRKPSFGKEELERVEVVAITVQEITGKQNLPGRTRT